MESVLKFIGIDLGGTNISCGIVTDRGEILYKDSIKTHANRNSDEIIADIINIINEVLISSHTKIEDIVSIGIGAPGAIDSKKGEVIFSGNLNWKNVNVTKKIEETYKVPCYVANDANVAALAEDMFGAGKGKKATFLITLGTGIGAGYILDGKIQSGAHNVGAELGHMIIEPRGILCTCGNRGCFERYASASALVARGIDAMQNNAECQIAKAAEGKKENISAKIIIDLAKDRDKIALKIFDDFTRYLAYGIVNIINIIDPEVIILGGGVSHAGQFLLDNVLPKVKSRIFCKQAFYAEILLSQIGNDAGILGAAMLRL